MATADSDALHGGEGDMVKNLKLTDLVFLGIAAIVGAGIFSTISKAAYDGGPGVIFLFLITAVSCGFTAMCYAEFASRVPVSGSAYTYSYVTFGEIVAWVIGWALILEYAIGNIVLAVSWSSYFNNLLHGVGINLPDWVVTDSFSAKRVYLDAVAKNVAPYNNAWLTAPTFAGFKLIINIPAMVITILLTALVYIGIKESKRSANIMVVLKLAILFVVVVVGAFYITPANWNPMLPNGFSGVMKGVSSVFFAYIGFDAISTTAEECKNPQRDLPRGMMLSLIICTVIYIITALIITGMVNYSLLNGVEDPLAFVFEQKHLDKMSYLISVSAIIATASVILVFQIGQPRIWMSMSRDGLLPKKFAELHPKYKTPGFATIIAGLLVSIPTLFVDADLMTDLTSIGTLFAFVLVCGGVLMLKPVEKGSKKFNLPYYNGQFVVLIFWLVFMYFFHSRFTTFFSAAGLHNYQEFLFVIFVLFSAGITYFTFIKKWSLIPVLGALCCSYLMIEIPAASWFVFFGWMGLGLLIYFFYSRKHSKLMGS